MDSSPRDLWCYDDAFEITKREQEQRDYFMATYHHEAIAVALANAFRGKNGQVHEWRTKTIQEDIREATGRYTEAEKQAKLEALFGGLETMQTNFNMSKS